VRRRSHYRTSICLAFDKSRPKFPPTEKFLSASRIANIFALKKRKKIRSGLVEKTRSFARGHSRLCFASAAKLDSFAVTVQRPSLYFGAAAYAVFGQGKCSVDLVYAVFRDQFQIAGSVLLQTVNS
jgi:hypothetical protein